MEDRILLLVCHLIIRKAWTWPCSGYHVQKYRFNRFMKGIGALPLPYLTHNTYWLIKVFVHFLPQICIIYHNVTPLVVHDILWRCMFRDQEWTNSKTNMGNIKYTILYGEELTSMKWTRGTSNDLDFLYIFLITHLYHLNDFWGKGELGTIYQF